MVEATGATATLGLVAAGLGISVLVDSYRSLRRAGVAMVPIEGLTSTLYVAWRDDHESAALPDFLETARGVAAGLEG